MSMTFADEPAECRPSHIIRDRDSKFTERFSSILETDGIKFRPIPARSPNMNPHAEAWVQRTKHEVLDHFIVFGEHHLRHILACWVIQLKKKDTAHPKGTVIDDRIRDHLFGGEGGNWLFDFAKDEVG